MHNLFETIEKFTRVYFRSSPFLNVRTNSKWDCCGVDRTGLAGSNSFLQYPCRYSASPFPPAFIFGSCPEHSCVIAVGHCTWCMKDPHTDRYTYALKHTWACNDPYINTHSHAHRAAYFFLPALFSYTPPIPSSSLQKDEVSSQLEVTPVDWTNGPEQAASALHCHSSYIQLGKMQKNHTCASPLDFQISFLLFNASVMPLHNRSYALQCGSRTHLKSLQDIKLGSHIRVKLWAWLT